MEGSGRPKASDYDEVTKEIILTATGIYHCLVSMSNAFPTPLEEVQLIKLAWDCENVETAQEVPIAVTSVTSLHSRSVLGRDSNKELSSIQVKGTPKGCEQSVVD